MIISITAAVITEVETPNIRIPLASLVGRPAGPMHELPELAEKEDAIPLIETGGKPGAAR
ncbi:MAG: hypothetical protein ACREYA_09735 [Cupriavidus necator]